MLIFYIQMLFSCWMWIWTGGFEGVTGNNFPNYHSCYLVNHSLSHSWRQIIFKIVNINICKILTIFLNYKYYLSIFIHHLNYLMFILVCVCIYQFSKSETTWTRNDTTIQMQPFSLWQWKITICLNFISWCILPTWTGLRVYETH